MTSKILKTISGVEIRVRANKSQRTFTLWKNGTKYRTHRMNKQEFEHAEWYWTGQDWAQFFKTDEYFVVK